MVIITPYRAQEKCIKSILEKRRLDGGCTVKTIDASQGKVVIALYPVPISIPTSQTLEWKQGLGTVQG